MSSYKLRKLHDALRRELRNRAKRRVDEMLATEDAETGKPMADTLLAHVAVGYVIEIDISVQVMHPEGPENKPNTTSGTPGLVMDA